MTTLTIPTPGAAGTSAGQAACRCAQHEPASAKACRHAAASPAPTDPVHHDHRHVATEPPRERARLTTSATLHCLSGCAIGEWLGLAIGVTLGLGPLLTLTLATLLGFASGYLLGLWPLVRRGARWRDAWRRLWLGETISIATMEFAMNVTDYHVGGIGAQSIFDGVFWLGYGVALPAGFLVAWPVNWWLLGRSIKQPCHVPAPTA